MPSPPSPHITIDNRLSAAAPLEAQIADLIAQPEYHEHDR